MEENGNYNNDYYSLHYAHINYDVFYDCNKRVRQDGHVAEYDK